MKSVLRGMELRAQEANASEDDAGVTCASQVSSAEAATTHEQLAELKLLSRGELGKSTNAVPSPTVVMETHTNEDDSRHARQDTGKVEMSTRSALTSQEQLLSPALSLRGGTERFRRASSLSTLCEEPLEDATAPIEECGNDDTTPRVEAAMTPASDCGPECDGDNVDERESAEEDGDSDSDEEGGVFAQMLSQLGSNPDRLVLSVGDITARRLDKVHAALLSNETASGDPETVDERFKSPQPEAVVVLSPRSHMRRIRTVIAVDTLRLLLERFGNERVRRATTSAIRLVFDQYARESSVESLRYAPATVTSRNIARVVLLTRQALVRDADAHQLNNSRRSTLSSPTKPQQRRLTQSQVPTLARTSAASNERASVHARTSSSSSPRSPTNDTGFRPLSPQRRSILASEGHHVLLQEKISAFQYRGTSSSGLAPFKVRRDGGAEVEAAAMRRLRAATFSKEHARKTGFK